jgi:hypothetical protein
VVINTSRKNDKTVNTFSIFSFLWIEIMNVSVNISNNKKEELILLQTRIHNMNDLHHKIWKRKKKNLVESWMLWWEMQQVIHVR